MPLGVRRVRSFHTTKPQRSSRNVVPPFRRSNTSESAGNKQYRRQSEMNIIGTEFMVSTEYTLERISEARENQSVTKLELEDLVLKDDIKESTQIHTAIKQLLQNDGKREWKYIKFLDQIEVQYSDYDNSEYYQSLLRQYGRAKELLWSQIEKHSRNKPVGFQVKLVFHPGTELQTTQQLLETIREELAVVLIDFGGALFNTSLEDIPTQLALQFKNNNNDHKYCLNNMVMLTLTWNRTKAYPTWTDATLKECIQKLGARGMGMLPLGETTSLNNNNNRSSSKNIGDGEREKEASWGQTSPRRSRRSRKGKVRESSNHHRHSSSISRSPSTAAARRDASRCSSSSKSPIPRTTSSSSSSRGRSSSSNNKRPVQSTKQQDDSPPPSPKETVNKPHSSPPPSPSKETVSSSTPTTPSSSYPSTSPPSPSSSSPYKDMKVTALRILCNARGINTTTMLEKQELIDALSC